MTGGEYKVSAPLPTGDRSRVFANEVACHACGSTGVPEGWVVLDVDHHPVPLDGEALRPSCQVCGEALDLGVLLVRRRPQPEMIWAQEGELDERDFETAQGIVAGFDDLTDDEVLVALPFALACYLAGRDPMADLASLPSDSPERYDEFLASWAESSLGPLVDAFVETPDWAAARRFVEKHPGLASEAAAAMATAKSERYDRQADIYDEHAQRLLVAYREGLDAAFPMTDASVAEAEEIVGLLFAGGLPADPEAATRTLAEAEAVLREAGDRATQAEVLRAMGVMARRRGNSEEAQARLDGALAIHWGIGNPYGMANTLRELGVLAQLRADLDRAQTHYEGALRICRELGDRQGEANARLRLGVLDERRGDLDSAQAHNEAALHSYREVGDRHGEGNARLQVGILAERRGNLDDAQSNSEAALHIFRDVGDRLGMANVRLQLGFLAQLRHDLDGAREHLGAAVALHREVGNRPGEANARRQLGVAARLLGDLGGAATNLVAALELHQQIGDRLGEANARRELGYLSRLRGDFRGAAAHLGEALALHHEIGDRLGEANARVELGVLARYRSDLEATTAHLEAALALYLEVGNRWGEAIALLDLSGPDRQRGNLDGATSRLEAALALYEEIGDRWGEAGALARLATIAQDRALADPANGDTLRREALSLALQAVRVFESVRTSQGTAETRAALYRQVRGTYVLALSLAAELEDGRAALEVTEAARADGVAAVLRRGRLEVGGEAGELLGRIRVLEAAAAEGDPGELGTERLVLDPAARAARRHELTGELEALYRRLGELTSAAFAAAYAPAPASGDPEAARAGVSPGAHVLAYELDDGGDEWVAYCTWVPPAGEPVVTASPLSPRARRLLARYGARDSAVAHEADPLPYVELAQALLPPGLAALVGERSDDDPVKLVVVPAGRLWALPWSALRLGDGRALVEAAVVALAPSLGVLAALAARPAPAGVGALVCVGAHPELDAGSERAALREVFEDLEEVAPAALAARLAQGPPRAHVVVTGVHGQAPEDAGAGLDHHLDLGGGARLRAAELVGVDLGGELTLGACFVNSPIARPGDEPLTLPTVALCAGAVAVVGGVFAVPDAATAALLGAYYRRLGTGLAPHRALREAQLERLRARPASPPSDWAGMVATGLGRV